MNHRSMLLLMVLCACSKPPAGHVVDGVFHSDALGVDKHYTAYLPGGYDAGSERYLVIYLLHGFGGNEHDWVRGGRVDQTADALGLRALIVMPDGDVSFYANSVTPADYASCASSPHAG